MNYPSPCSLLFSFSLILTLLTFYYKTNCNYMNKFVFTLIIFVHNVFFNQTLLVQYIINIHPIIKSKFSVICVRWLFLFYTPCVNENVKNVVACLFIDQLMNKSNLVKQLFIFSNMSICCTYYPQTHTHIQRK